MVLYLAPPTGSISLRRLEKYAKARLRFLMQVTSHHRNGIDLQDLVLEKMFVETADCLIEGNKEDALSHFILRLACARSEAMAQFFIEAETMFFMFRLSRMRDDELKSYVIEPLKILYTSLLAATAAISYIFSELLDILEHLNLTNRKSMFNQSPERRKEHQLILPFVHVLKLVSNRSVLIRRGMACIPYSKISFIFETIFTYIITEGIGDAKKQLMRTEDDLRMKKLFMELQETFRQYYDKAPCSKFLQGYITADRVDECAEMFPPCMSQLHYQLRLQHRLRHNDRIQYTLFLKDIGMSLSEALVFWQAEYSKPPVDKACEHSWNKDARRYIYNIRHLYGCEGARINYRGHCCESLQKRILSPQEIGGCPFSIWDEAKLQSILSSEFMSPECLKEIRGSVMSDQPFTACKLYLEHKVKKTIIEGHDLQLLQQFDEKYMDGNLKNIPQGKLENSRTNTIGCESNKLKCGPMREKDECINQDASSLKIARCNASIHNLGKLEPSVGLFAYTLGQNANFESGVVQGKTNYQKKSDISIRNGISNGIGTNVGNETSTSHVWSPRSFSIETEEQILTERPNKHVRAFYKPSQYTQVYLDLLHGLRSLESQ